MSYPGSDPAPSFPYSRYNVGWIAPMLKERVAAIAMLDSTHGAPEGLRNTNDPLYYVCGSMNGQGGVHYVVIATPNRIGLQDAGVTAQAMLSSFPSIKFGLLVGIGGGVPQGPNQPLDVRLGDVVVSTENGHESGVIQYDHGKWTRDGFEPNYRFVAPPPVLSNAVTHLRSLYLPNGTNWISDYVEKMQQKYRGLMQNDTYGQIGYVYPGCEKDTMSRGSCGVYYEGTCRNTECKKPKVHFGSIASGSGVIKDEIQREWLRKKCICFDMEAAGLMNNFPCLVVRGISDYCDGNKNDAWQNYASAVAAAYTKTLLSVIYPSEVEGGDDGE
ncbi:purine and uridine phosphorylase [Trichodelitschia bisporula]|uniref:Purine and uridine phosphorylase n=1 Tax=Trichodelitschia bisporula TaxID=703511 RepID=A0A6G1HRW5_9PEZI|nr:purine and uridine phosphorylase [Trichodelitschia bisporula]